MSPLFKRSRRADAAPENQADRADGVAAPAEPDAPAAATDAPAAATDAPAAANDADPTEETVADTAKSASSGGPFDVTEVAERGRRLDFGSIWLPIRAGMAVRLDVDKASRQPVALSILHDGSTLRLQAFAAPKKAGLWEEICTELVSQTQESGGKAELVNGPFGKEVFAVMPVEGKKSKQRIRFVGVDGPRWFLRGRLSGPAATDSAAARLLLEVFSGVVVVRGTEAHPPKNLLRLHPPGEGPKPEAEEQATAGEKVFLRGPEVTEVR